MFAVKLLIKLVVASNSYIALNMLPLHIMLPKASAYVKC